MPSSVVPSVYKTTWAGLLAGLLLNSFLLIPIYLCTYLFLPPLVLVVHIPPHHSFPRTKTETLTPPAFPPSLCPIKETMSFCLGGGGEIWRCPLIHSMRAAPPPAGPRAQVPDPVPFLSSSSAPTLRQKCMCKPLSFPALPSPLSLGRWD